MTLGSRRMKWRHICATSKWRMKQKGWTYHKWSGILIRLLLGEAHHAYFSLSDDEADNYNLLAADILARCRQACCAWVLQVGVRTTCRTKGADGSAQSDCSQVVSARVSYISQGGRTCGDGLCDGFWQLTGGSSCAHHDRGPPGYSVYSLVAGIILEMPVLLLLGCDWPSLLPEKESHIQSKCNSGRLQ